MKSLILSFCVLIIGYFSYGKIVEKIFAPDERETPAFRLDDGVDFVPLKTWAAAGVAFYGETGSLSEALSGLGQSGVVYDISTGMLGTVGGVLAIIGVVACPITSGDTAFRSARLILGEITGLEQKPIKNRLYITLPLLTVGAFLTQLEILPRLV